MRLFVGALVLNFMVFCNEIEASGLRRIMPKPSGNDREEIDHLVTSSLHTQSSSTYNNFPFPAHQALYGYHPHPQESLHQESTTVENLSGYLDHIEGIDHLVPSRFPAQSSSTYNNPPLQAHQALDSGGYQSYSPQSVNQQSHEHHSYPQDYLRQLNPGEVSSLVHRYNFDGGRLPNVDSHEWLVRDYLRNKNRKKQEDSPDYLKQDNIDWLLEQKREFELEVLRQEKIEAEMEYMKMKSGEIVQMPSMRNYRYKNLHKEKLSEEEKPKKQRAVRIREPVSSQNNIKESAMNDHANRNIGRRVKGKADQTNVLGSRAKGKAAGRKGVSDSRFKAEAAGRKNVLDSHDQLSQQSQHSEDDSDEFVPTLIPSHLSNFNPYQDFPKNNPNHPNQWGHPGGSGSGSHQ